MKALAGTGVQRPCIGPLSRSRGALAPAANADGGNHVSVVPAIGSSSVAVVEL